MPLIGSLARTHVNFEIVSQDDWLIFQEIFVDRTYAPAVDLWFPRFASFDTSHLDLGSNRGYFSTFLAHRLLDMGLWNFQIHSVDALQANIDLAKDRLLKQHVVKMENRVHYHHGAVGLREGTGNFTTSQESRMNKLVDSVVPEDNAVVIPYLDLDLLHPGTVGILKCDIEGAEEVFLRTYQDTLLRRTQVAVFELHHQEVNVPRCREYLKNAGLLPAHCVMQGGVSVEVFAR